MDYLGLFAYRWLCIANYVKTFGLICLVHSTSTIVDECRRLCVLHTHGRAVPKKTDRARTWGAKRTGRSRLRRRPSSHWCRTHHGITTIDGAVHDSCYKMCVCGCSGHHAHVSNTLMVFALTHSATHTHTPIEMRHAPVPVCWWCWKPGVSAFRIECNVNSIYSVELHTI